MVLSLFMQITLRKSELAKLEAMDCGKPLDEAAWDIVCPQTTWNVFSSLGCTNDLHASLWHAGWCCWMFWVLRRPCWRLGCKAKSSCFSSNGDIQVSCSEGTDWCCWPNHSMVVVASFADHMWFIFLSSFFSLFVEWWVHKSILGWTIACKHCSLSFLVIIHFAWWSYFTIFSLLCMVSSFFCLEA